MITLGTGIGSALFVDGTLVPNSELGHLRLRHHGKAEDWAAESVRQREQVSWRDYAGRLQSYFELVQRVLWPQLIIVGGGISNVADEFLPWIELRTPIVPAQLRNHAGIIGAALYSPEGQRLLSSELNPTLDHGAAVTTTTTKHDAETVSVVGMHTFGASAPLKQLLTKFGFTPDRVAELARDRIVAARSRHG